MRWQIIKDQSGAAAAEMALVTPLLIIIMFGAFEMGSYFRDNHVVAKAVRDGARFASRQKFDKYDCAATSVDSTVVTNTKNVTRTGKVASNGTARLNYWSDPATITVGLHCDDSGTYGAFYEGMTDGVPIVSVSVTVPYRSLFSTLGFNTTNVNIVAYSEVPVMGI